MYLLTIYDRLCCDIINLLLGRISIEDTIESEFLLTESSQVLFAQIQGDVLLVRIEAQTYLRTHFNFLSVQRTHTRYDYDVSSLDLYSLRATLSCSCSGFDRD